MYENSIIQLNDNELRKYQECVLSVAKDLIAICELEGIDYSLSGGSILGAIRHKGFIPWDDDIDINIPRKSYDKLISIFNDRLGDKYYIQTPLEYPEMGILVTQVRKKNTVARRKYDWKLKECGVSIDIYVIENVFDNPFKRLVQKCFSMVCSFAVSAIRTCNNENIPKELIELEGRNLNYTKSKLILGKIFGIIPLNRWIIWCDYWFTKCTDSDSKLVSIPTGRKHFSGEMYFRKDMCLFRKELFETEMFNVPIEAEKYLRCFYGDYMKLPPENRRERHLFLELRY